MDGYNAQSAWLRLKMAHGPLVIMAMILPVDRVSRIIHGLTNTTQIYYVYSLEDPSTWRNIMGAAGA